MSSVHFFTDSKSLYDSDRQNNIDYLTLPYHTLPYFRYAWYGDGHFIKGVLFYYKVIRLYKAALAMEEKHTKVFSRKISIISSLPYVKVR